MGIETLGSNNQRVRDELSSEPDVQSIYKIKSETVKVEEATIKYTQDTIGASWIVGSATNGLVGTNTGTQSGGQQVVGGSGRVQTTLFVGSPNKTYQEVFNFTTYEDTGSTTADWADTLGTLAMTNTEIAQSLSIAYANGTIYKATLTVNISSGSSGDLSLQLTADGGSNWENATIGSQHTFTNTGTDLRFKLTASGTVTITKITVQYE